MVCEEVSWSCKVSQHITVLPPPEDGCLEPTLQELTSEWNIKSIASEKFVRFMCGFS